MFPSKKDDFINGIKNIIGRKKCTICMCSTYNCKKLFTCDHTDYHLDCIKLAPNGSLTNCPICRAPSLIKDKKTSPNSRHVPSRVWHNSDRMLVWHNGTNTMMLKENIG